MAETALAPIEAWETALVEMTDPVDVKSLLDKGMALEDLVRRQRQEQPKILRLQKFLRDAERRLGELIPSAITGFQGESLSSLGISHSQSHRYQLMSRWPQAEYLDHWRKAEKQGVDNFTAAAIYNEAWKWEHGNGGLSGEPFKVPAGQFGCIVIDPPWPYQTGYSQSGRRAANPYGEITIEALEATELPAASDTVLWLWTTNTFIHDAFHLIEAWDFEYKTILTWVKDRMGLGQWLRGQTEHCLVAVKGKPRWKLTNQTTALMGPLREHSRKPDEFYALVEAICDGPRLEMFSRSRRDGWEVHGNDVSKFS